MITITINYNLIQVLETIIIQNYATKIRNGDMDALIEQLLPPVGSDQAHADGIQRIGHFSSQVIDVVSTPHVQNATLDGVFVRNEAAQGSVEHFHYLVSLVLIFWLRVIEICQDPPFLHRLLLTYGIATQRIDVAAGFSVDKTSSFRLLQVHPLSRGGIDGACDAVVEIGSACKGEKGFGAGSRGGLEYVTVLQEHFAFQQSPLYRQCCVVVYVSFICFG